MSTIHATIRVHTAAYTIDKPSGPLVRPVEIAVVRRLRKGKTTRISVVDAGSATRTTARATALGMGTTDIRVHPDTDHGHLGTFADNDEGRDLMLAAVRALPLFDAPLVVTPGGFGGVQVWRGQAPVTYLDSTSPTAC